MCGLVIQINLLDNFKNQNFKLFSKKCALIQFQIFISSFIHPALQNNFFSLLILFTYTSYYYYIVALIYKVVLVSFTSYFHYNIYNLESVECTERCALPPCFYCCLLAAFLFCKMCFEFFLSFCIHIDVLCVHTVSHAGLGFS
jgi:hypothetical protein